MANTPNKQPTKGKNDSTNGSSVTDAAERFGGSSQGSNGSATATARSFYDQAKETAGQAYEAVSEKAVTKIDEQKSTLSGGLSTVADSIRQVGDNLGSTETESALAGSAAKYTQTAARKIEDVADYFETNSVSDMARDVESFARRNPMIFLGAAFGLGFLAARFLKSTPPQRLSAAAGQPFADAPSDSTRSRKSSTRRSETAFTAASGEESI